MQHRGQLPQRSYHGQSVAERVVVGLFRREPKHVAKDDQGNILTDRTKVLQGRNDGSTNVDVAAGLRGERDSLSEKERTGAWRRIRVEAAKEPTKIK